MGIPAVTQKSGGQGYKRMGFFLKQEVQGAVSILLVVIMVPLMVLSALMVDTARYSLSKSMVASAGDLAMNAALADYDTILKDVYGLFAMSQADDVEQNVKRYFEDTLVSYGVVGKEDAGAYVESLLGALYQSMVLDGTEAANFMSMTVDMDRTRVEKVQDSSLANAAVLEKQIVEYMKYRGPVDFGLSFFDSLSAFTKVEEQTTVIESQVKAQEEMGDVAEANSRLYQDIAGKDQDGHHIDGFDDSYRKLQDNADEGFRLMDYRNILQSYRERYENVHRLAVVFCVSAYGGVSGVSKWELDDSDLYVLSGSGDYITGSGVPDTRNTDFAERSYDSFFKNEVDGLWSDGDTNRLNQLYGGRKFGSVNFLGSGYCCFVSKDGQAQAMDEFSDADLFYKKDYGEYRTLLDRLDRYLAAAKRFDVAVGAEIEKQQEIIRRAQEERKRQEQKQKEAENAIKDSRDNLSDWNYDSYQEELADYEKNQQEMDGASEEDRQRLQEDNERILEDIGGYFPPGTENPASFAQDVISEKNSIEANSEARDQCAQKISEQKGMEGSAQQYIDQILKPEQAAVAQRLQDVLNGCRISTNAYNADLREYKSYKTAVRNWISGEVNQMAIQFNTIYGNLELLEGQLKKALDDLALARIAISAYLGAVDNWENANNTYQSGANGGSGDNFSMTNGEDIKAARDTFDLEEVEELRKELQKRYDLVRNFRMALDRNFHYMDKECIGKITTAERVREVVKGSAVGAEITAYGQNGVSSQASDVSIDAWFLYTDDIGQEAEALQDLKKLTEPCPCCSFMNYLHQTFRADNRGAEGSDVRKKQDDDKSGYDTIKGGGGGIADNVKKSGGSGTMPDLGYQYNREPKPAHIEGDEYPSAQYKAWITSVTQNTDTSSGGLAANKAIASGLLSGLGNAMETGRDKLLVTSYLFENFSYNTIVQDMAREQHKDLQWPGNYKEEYYTPVLGQAKTSSGIAINGVNNPLYGAEIEYVLFGNPNPETNVTCMKGSIFAIRMLFNSIYAFTDSEIRNMARGVGLSVQAATLGVVPYQLVMVVVQLALAIGESAIDLEKMNVGEQVAIIKSDSTWMLSGQGMMNLAKATVNKWAGEVVNEGARFIENKISEIVDAGAEELSGIVNNMGESLNTYAESAVEETVSRIFARIETTVETCVNDIAYLKEGELPENLESAKSQMYGLVDEAFGKIKADLTGAQGYLGSRRSDDSVEGKVCAAICGGSGENQPLDTILDGMAAAIKNKISSAGTLEEARGALYSQAYGIRETVSNQLKGLTKGIVNSATTALKGIISETEKAIKDKAGEAVEKGAEAAKEAVVGEINNFMDKISAGSSSLNTGSSTSLAQTNGVNTGSGNLATQIKFGYSDYLKLFVFIGLCASDKSGAMICRIGDLIQYNISKAGADSALRSKAGDKFTMQEAKTYISVDAIVDLDMMFLNLGIFQKQIESYNRELAEDQQIDLDSTLQVHYIGISGY